MLIIRMPCGGDHMHILRLRQIELQVSMPILLDDVEPVGVFGNVGIEQVVVDMEQIVDQLSVQLVVIVVYPIALLEALVTVPSLGSKAVNCNLVNAVEVNWLVVNSDRFD